MDYSGVLVTGESGLVGTALKKVLPNAIYVGHQDYDLTDERQVYEMYNEIMPYRVIHLAARVGGIYDNIQRPAEYLDQNVLMNTNMVKYAKLFNVKRFLGVLSSCVFPDTMDKYPMEEEDMHKGAPPSTNFAYAIAKRLLAVQIDSYNQQYETKYNYIIPCNIYGENDKDDPSKSHFMSSLMKKIYEAERDGRDSITIWGDGTVLRQFIYSGDVARIIKEIVDRDITESFNVATPYNLSIRDAIDLVFLSANTKLKVKYDTTKPTGQYRKDLSIKKLQALIPDFNFTPTVIGISNTYKSYKELHDAK